MTRPDPGFLAEARERAVQVMTEAVMADLAASPWLPVRLLPFGWFAARQRKALTALLALPEPTRAALLGDPG